MPTQTGSFDFKGIKSASAKATNYITDLSNGVYVHADGTPTDPTSATAKGVRITDDIDIIRNGTSVVNISSDITIGNGNNYVNISNNGFKLRSGIGGTLFEIDSDGTMLRTAQVAKYNGSSTSTDTQSLTADTMTQIVLSNKLFAFDDMFSLNNGGMLTQWYGIYRITASVYVNAAQSTTQVGVFVRQDNNVNPSSHSWANATEIGAGRSVKPTTSSEWMIAQTSFIYDQGASDEVTYFLGVRTSNGTGSLRPGNMMTFLEIEYLGW